MGKARAKIVEAHALHSVIPLSSLRQRGVMVVAQLAQATMKQKTDSKKPSQGQHYLRSWGDNGALALFGLDGLGCCPHHPVRVVTGWTRRRRCRTGALRYSLRLDRFRPGAFVLFAIKTNGETDNRRIRKPQEIKDDLEKRGNEPTWRTSHMPGEGGKD